jgi:photosystem II stability/assembly factor-like uncharacterized protein
MNRLLLAAALTAAAPTVAPAAVLGAAPPPAAAGPVPDRLFEPLRWRLVGPFRGGRVTAVAGVPGQPLVYYMGATGGGVWKTTTAGNEWVPVADGHVKTGSVGALAVAPSDPNVVYAGMGESCIRGNVSHGDGVYRSTDAGKTWTHVGLRDTMQIGRIRVHPRDPDHVYVAALGHTWGPNAERGVFRSRDGGKTWSKVLFVDEGTGAVDLAMDEANPRVLYAAFWQARRTPWNLESGGPGSGLYKTTDGGDTWTKLDGTHQAGAWRGKGLPKGPWGRVGVSVSPARPDRVYAVVEAEEGGVFRSDDAGASWERTNDERKLRQRAWYYTHVHADPREPDTVYVLNVELFRSKDGGTTFEAVRVPHGDNHDLWIAPEDPRRMIEGNDGGAAVTFDGGLSWSTIDNQPTAQLYHVIADDQFPYRLYGAQQDNTTVSIASRTATSGIGEKDWDEVAGCESGTIAPKPGDPDVTYAGCYGGYLGRLDRRTGQQRAITVWPENPMGWGAEGMRYRFQWTFPIVASRHDPSVLYAGANVLFRTTDEGSSWAAVSPDLTRNDRSKMGPSGGPITKDNTSVEYYGTLFALAESPLDGMVLWAGSDDGLVHVTRDGGKTWSNVTPPGMPEWSRISQIDASPHEAGTAWLAVNRYQLDDYRPYVYATTDFGATWRLAAGGLPADSFVRVVREDPVRRGLLFAGTETGVHVSFDAGSSWRSLQRNLPAVPVTDLVVKGDDVAVSTQGRAFWILDDVAPLRQWRPEVESAPVHLFEPSAAWRFGGSEGRGAVGTNPPYGARFYYWLKEAPRDGEEVALEVLDPKGAVVSRFTSKEEKAPIGKSQSAGGETGEGARAGAEAGESGRAGGDAAKPIPAKAGLNAFSWDLRYPPASKFEGLVLWGGELEGPRAVPGRYEVRLAAAGRTLVRPFEVRKDPRLATTDEDFALQFSLLRRIRDQLAAAHDGIVRLRAVREQAREAAGRAKGTPAEKAVAGAAEALAGELTAIEETLYQTKNRASQDPLNYPIRLNNKLAALASTVASADARPTEQAHAVHRELSALLDAQLATLERVLAEDVPAFNRLMREGDVPAVRLPKP